MPFQSMRKVGRNAVCAWLLVACWLPVLGASAAFAEGETKDLAPSAQELFRGNARSVRLPSATACDPSTRSQAELQRQEAMARMIAQMMQDDGSGRGRALRNGYGYVVQRNPMHEMARIRQEAAEQRTP